MFQKRLCGKICYEVSTKCRSGGGVCIFEFVRMYLFAAASQTHGLLFTKVKDENTESISNQSFIQVVGLTRKRLGRLRLLVLLRFNVQANKSHSNLEI